MFSFIKSFFLFSLTAVLVIAIILLIFLTIFNLSYTDLPDPGISNSWGLNQKMSLLRGRNVDILGIGASVTDNNLDSRIVIEALNTKSFFAASSVGLAKKDIYEFIKMYNEIHKLKKIIITSGLSDYIHEAKAVDYTHLKNYLTSSGYGQISLKKFSLQYLLCGMSVKRAQKVNGDYKNITSGSYEYYGTQILKKSPVNPILREAYQQELLGDFANYCHKKELKQQGLNYLDSISIFCKKNDITLYYFQAALDQSYISGRKNILDSIESLANTEEKIINGRNQYYVKTYNKIWDDSLFTDYQHMNEIGASVFTRYCLDQIKGKQ